MGGSVPVFDDARRGDAPFQHLRGKLVVVAEVREPDNVVARLAILRRTILILVGEKVRSKNKLNSLFSCLNEHDCGDDFYPQPLCKEGALLGVDLDEFGLEVLPGQDPEVLVHNLGGSILGILADT